MLLTKLTEMNDFIFCLLGDGYARNSVASTPVSVKQSFN